MQQDVTRLLGTRRPSPLAALLIVLCVVGGTTLALYPLKQVAPVVSLGVVYLLGVLLVSMYLGLAWGLVTALLSAIAFNFFHLPPLHRFTLANSQDWVALAAFVIVAALTSRVADVARSTARDAEQQRREADLAADLARALLGSKDRAASMREAARLVAEAVDAETVELEVPPRTTPAGSERLALEITDEGRAVGRLLVRGRLDPSAEERLRNRIAPTVQTLVVIALQRDALQAEAIETAALRRSEELKTALLRMVSHDLRSPLTTIVTAGHAVQSDSITAEDRHELGDAIVREGERLSELVANMLDLSRLEARAAEPRRVELGIEEVLETVTAGERDHVELRLAPDLPLIVADPAQLERAFANVIQNAIKHAGGRTVQVRAAAVGDRVVVRVVDQGRGIPAAELTRIFEAFERGADAANRPGSGLGLAIAKGFVEANGGRIVAESVPGQGSSFVVTFPIKRDATVPA